MAQYLGLDSSTQSLSAIVIDADAGTIVVISEDSRTRIREGYRVTDQNHFTYSMELSEDEGRTWGPIQIEITMARVD